MLIWSRDLFITTSDFFFCIKNFQAKLSTLPAQIFQPGIIYQLQIWDWEFVKLGGEQLILIISIILPFFQVVKMFMVVVVIFAICWLPYHVYFIYTYHNKEVTTKPYIQHVYLSFYWLAMANAMINPAIYYGMNARYVQQ